MDIQHLYDQISYLPEVYRTKTRELIAHNEALLLVAPGSRHNHQAWAGGYIDHIRECITIARALYPALLNIRTAPFALDDACLALFYHDLEKPWRHAGAEIDDAHTFRLQKLAEHGLNLDEPVLHAIKYTHGEGAGYRNDRRVQTPLGAFVHCCDTISARVWYDHPFA